jgi:hypothetical protein
MASQEAADAAALIALKRGSVELQEFNGLKVGTRVRHVGEQFSAAYRNGTGTIERIFHLEKSSWTQKYHRPDIELIVKRDNPSSPDDVYRFLADYHVEVVEAPSQEEAQ